MPLYEYKCTKCSKIIELFVKNTSDSIAPLHFSDFCEAEPTVRVISKTSFKFDNKCLSSNDKSITIQSSIDELKSNLSKTKDEFKNDSNKASS